MTEAQVGVIQAVSFTPTAHSITVQPPSPNSFCHWPIHTYILILYSYPSSKTTYVTPLYSTYCLLLCSSLYFFTCFFLDAPPQPQLHCSCLHRITPSFFPLPFPSLPPKPIFCCSLSFKQQQLPLLFKNPINSSKNPDCNGSKASMDDVSSTETNKQVFESEEVLAADLAEYVTHLSDQFAKTRGAFTVVLSGGSLVKFLRKLVEPPCIDWLDWSKWHVVWADERVVPKDLPDSNYFLAYNDFLSKIPIPTGNIYAINDAMSTEGAADDYEICPKHLVKNKTIQVSEVNGFPKFDLILLGMGSDGHVIEEEKWVTFIEDSPKPPPERITLTFSIINSSVHIALVVAGAGKADAVCSTLGRRDHNSYLLPVQMVSPQGELKWFLDKGAASKLYGNIP